MKYDFNKSVAAAKRDYPAETKAITFIDTASPMAKLQLRCWFWRASKPFKKLMMSGAGAKSAAGVADFIVKSGFTALRDPLTGRGLAAINSRYKGPMPIDNLDYSFDHELAHLVVPGAIKMDLSANMLPNRSEFNMRETKADVFAALRGLRRKTLEKADVAQLSLNRALDAYFKHDIDHATTKGIDKLLASLDDAKAAILTPPQIQAVAFQYGEAFAMHLHDISDFYDHFYGLPRPENNSTEACLNALLGVALKTDTAPVPARLAAHILGHILDAGSTAYPTAYTFDVMNAAYDDQRAKLAKHLSGSELEKSLQARRPAPKGATA